jgi:hypothetical protein
LHRPVRQRGLRGMGFATPVAAAAKYLPERRRANWRKVKQQ